VTHSGWWGGFGALAWCVLPASYAYATLLSQPGLAMATMAVAFYLLYRFCRTRRNIYAAAFLAALLTASLTRNVVQIHVFVIVVIAAIAFYLMGRPRSVGALVINLALVVLIGSWPTRAFVMYSTFDVSTHTGYNRAGALWIKPDSVPVPAWPENIQRNATVLSSGWNTQETLKDNYRLGAAANELMLRHPLDAAGRLMKSLTITIPAGLRSIYVQWYDSFLFANPFVPWIDWFFSGFRFPLLIGASFTIFFGTRGWSGTRRWARRYAWFLVIWILIAIPVAFSNRYWPPDAAEPTASEADRLRSLIDIPIYVVMTYALWTVVNRVRARRGLRVPVTTEGAPRSDLTNHADA
ncbi:MAG: hypothetical protein WCI74_12930, partial [Actinomycetes bacterium]